MGKYRRALLCYATMANLLFACGGAAAAELGSLCWLTEAGTLLRFSVTEAGPGHYTYTGAFDDNDGAAFAISGHAEVSGGMLVGSFSGSKTSASNFRTAIYRVTIDPATLAGSGEGIRHSYDRLTANISTAYRSHTLVFTPCP